MNYSSAKGYLRLKNTKFEGTGSFSLSMSKVSDCLKVCEEHNCAGVKIKGRNCALYGYVDIDYNDRLKLDSDYETYISASM